MYETILVPTDGSSDARKGAEHAIGLAAALGATVHALYVIREGTNPWNPASLDDQMDRAREYGEELTGEIADLAADAGVECVTATAVGPEVHEEINE
jgi:nucleotide-binding universal stress UspA family protein